jgi:hypothetical protein
LGIKVFRIFPHVILVFTLGAEREQEQTGQVWTGILAA